MSRGEAGWQGPRESGPISGQRGACLVTQVRPGDSARGAVLLLLGLLEIPTLGCCPEMTKPSRTAAHLFVLCVLPAFGWFYRYDGKFPTIRKVGLEVGCCAVCHWVCCGVWPFQALFFVFPVNSNLCELDRSLGGLTLSMCPYQADIKCQGVSQKHCGGEGGRFGE